MPPATPDHRPAPADVTRVICAAVSRVEGAVMDQLFTLRNRLCSAEPAPRVRAALLYSHGWFVYWLEGDAAAVDKVLARAAQDPRNDDPCVLHRSRGPATLTGALTLVTAQGTGGPAAFGRRVMQFARDRLALEPVALWQRLIAPCTAGRDCGPACLPARQFALVSSEDNGPIDLLRRLGEQHGSGTGVVYQRFASARSHSTDVGVAYVDIEVAGVVTRVHLLSRRALGHAMVHHALAGLDGLLMLMGTRVAAAIDLAAAVADCVNALAMPPRIYQVTTSAEVAEAVRKLLQRATSEQPAVEQVPGHGIEDFLLGRIRQLAPATSQYACA